MTVRKVERGGEPRLVIDIPYKTADGRSERYRRDAQVQTKTGAEAEHRRLLVELAKTGTLKRAPEPEPEAVQANRATFGDAVKRFKETRMPALKPSTRISYGERLKKLLVPRFGDTPLEELNRTSLATLDAELASEEIAPSTRRNFHIVFRAVMRCAVDSELLAALPSFPPLPRVGRKVTKPLRRSDLDAILAVARPNVQLAFALAAFAGLRAGEVRGLRWPDVELKAGTITIRRSITRGEESTPKNGNQEVLPIATQLGAILETAKASRKDPWANVALTKKGQQWGEWGLRQAFAKAQKRAGREGWSFHDLRHFFISELFRNGVSAPVARCLARHSDLGTTQRYADVDANDLRAAINRINGNAVEIASQNVTATP